MRGALEKSDVRAARDSEVHQESTASHASSRLGRGTSLIRKHPPLGPYRRPTPRVLGVS